MDEPLIDVIVPVYNCASYIGEAISSIQAQTFKNVKIIVVDDGSEDQSAAIAMEFAKTDDRILVIKQPHMGVQFALNTAISQTNSVYIAFLDSDDLWHSQKLEKQLQLLTNNDLEICFCMIQEFEDAGMLNQILSHRARVNAMKGYNKTACLMRREVFNKYGLFDESVIMGDFIEWFSRVVRAQKSVGMIDEVLSYRRVHKTNTTLTADRKSYLHILKKHLDESRKINKA